MPRGDRTGPSGQGPGTGGGSGRGGGQGQGLGRGGGRGRMGGTQPGAGPQGECVCPSCGVRVPHQVGTPCYDLSCPQCGTKMVRG